MAEAEPEAGLEVVEICAGAGGQSHGLEKAGFRHKLAVELDKNAADTLRQNLPNGEDVVQVGDVADESIWRPEDYVGIDLLAGGVPCPPFSIAGKQLGTADERELFAWAVQLCEKGRMRPKALLLENVRGLATNRFAGYRQHVLDMLSSYGYIAFWNLLEARDFGVSQLRPRFVLVALLPEYAPYFRWPTPHKEAPPSVGELLKDLMASNDWEPEQVDAWVKKADGIAPTIVGGSKRHGGADLGPTRAKAAWARLGVDAMGLADEPPKRGWRPEKGAPGPKLTTKMVARIQGWKDREWDFKGRKTSTYRQIGNAFPPPVAQAIGESIRAALEQRGKPQKLLETTDTVHDPVYKVLREIERPVTVDQIIAKLAKGAPPMSQPEVERHLIHLAKDFAMRTVTRSNGAIAFELGDFKGFVGQHDHQRHELFSAHRGKIS